MSRPKPPPSREQRLNKVDPVIAPANNSGSSTQAHREPVTIPSDKFATCLGCDHIFTKMGSEEPCKSCTASNFKHTGQGQQAKQQAKGAWRGKVMGDKGIELCPRCKKTELEWYESPNGVLKKACKACRKTF